MLPRKSIEKLDVLRCFSLMRTISFIFELQSHKSKPEHMQTKTSLYYRAASPQNSKQNISTPKTLVCPTQPAELRSSTPLETIELIIERSSSLSCTRSKRRSLDNSSGALACFARIPVCVLLGLMMGAEAH